MAGSRDFPDVVRCGEILAVVSWQPFFHFNLRMLIGDSAIAITSLLACKTMSEDMKCLIF